MQATGNSGGAEGKAVPIEVAAEQNERSGHAWNQLHATKPHTYRDEIEYQRKSENVPQI
jgi:hypothetical protein